MSMQTANLHKHQFVNSLWGKDVISPPLCSATMQTSGVLLGGGGEWISSPLVISNTVLQPFAISVSQGQGCCLTLPIEHALRTWRQSQSSAVQNLAKSPKATAPSLWAPIFLLGLVILNLLSDLWFFYWAPFYIFKILLLLFDPEFLVVGGFYIWYRMHSFTKA